MQVNILEMHVYDRTMHSLFNYQEMVYKYTYSLFHYYIAGLTYQKASTGYC